MLVDELCNLLDLCVNAFENTWPDRSERLRMLMVTVQKAVAHAHARNKKENGQRYRELVRLRNEIKAATVEIERLREELKRFGQV